MLIQVALEEECGRYVNGDGLVRGPDRNQQRARPYLAPQPWLLRVRTLEDIAPRDDVWESLGYPRWRPPRTSE